ncbi:MAG: hypothetical protein J6R52_02660 [Alphaproteobacteria bacterium]|nr:hypothetical protein [Alphaproteobacteria bacterium]
MIRFKEYKLLQDIETYTKQHNSYKLEAKRIKYASVFAGASTGIATIAAIVNAIESGITDDKTLLLTLAAITFGFITNFSHADYKKTEQTAKKYKKKLRKKNIALQKIQKTRQ